MGKAGVAHGYANLGVIHRTRGDLDQARELWIKSRDLYDRIGMPHMVDEVGGWLAELPEPPARPAPSGKPRALP